MRPIKLTMSAFASYSGEQVIDFSLLDGKNLFLICGPTGAGKTTVFDAICYALYGKISGDKNEKTDYLRSQFAQKKATCFVELIFKSKEKIYTIKRYPPQMMFSKKYDCYKPKTAKAELTLPNGDIFSKTNEINQKIEETLQLNYKQFKQIVMLAQGEFREFLDAKSTDKQEILRKLFGTQIFDDFKRTLNDKDNLGEAKINAHERELKETIKQINCENNINLKKLCDLENPPINNVLDTLELHIKNESIQKNQLMQRIENLEKSIRLIDIDGYKNTNKKFDQFAQISNELDELKKQEQDIDKYKKIALKIKTLKNIKPFYDNFISLNIKKDALTNKIIEIKIKDKELKQELETITEKYKNIPEHKIKQEKLKNSLIKAKNYLETLIKIDEYKEKIKKLNHDKIKSEKNIKLINLLVKRCNIYDNLEVFNKIKAILQEIAEKDCEYENIVVSYKNKVKYLEDITNDFYDSQASILANLLKENTPCPVCGSIHHPIPAKTNHENITQELIKSAQKDVDKLYKEITTIKGNIEVLTQNLNDKKSIILKNNENIDISVVNKLINKQNDDIEQINKEISDVISINNVNDNRYKNIDYLNQNLQKISSDIGEISGKISSCNEQLTTLSNSLSEEIDCEDKIILLIKSYEEQIKSIENYIEKTNDKYNKINNLYGINTQTISLKNEEISLVLDELNICEKNLNEKLAQSCFNDYKSLEYNFTYIKDELKIQKSIDDYEKFYIELNTRFVYLKEELKDKNPVNLEEITNKYDELQQEISCLTKEKEDLLLTININKKLLLNISDTYSQKKKLYEKQHNIHELSRLASGNNNHKLTFESYVLSGYFDEIIAHANSRLFTMTNSRYTLNRKKDRSKGKGYSGLDLEILDRYSGFKRHISTLSGGESFKASLCLALGLADVLRNHFGGVDVETMFIDEGFGSLDPQSLDSAVETLFSLQSSGTLVGIISHVPALAEKIQTKLIVTSSANGSKAHFEII